MTYSFSDLGVPPRLVEHLRSGGITTPFPIQAAAIPDAIAGRDVCGKAPTGSGKTLAFGLAIAAKKARSKPGFPTSVVLVPTRELAAQVCTELAALAREPRRTIAVYGGTSYGPTRKALSRGVDTVVACPGRLEDLIKQGTLSIAEVSTVVIDEADRMSDMGFLPSVRRLLNMTSKERQVMLFSATFGPEIDSIVESYLRRPVFHDAVPDKSSVGEVSHAFWKTERSERLGLTVGLVRTHGSAVIFCRTRRGVDRVAKQLSAAGVSAVSIHGDRSQAQRERALARFSDGTAQALVATDVAARGIHVADLPCVVHYDPAASPTDYLHRSGRTGRAGRTGAVVSLVTADQAASVRGLQTALGLSDSGEVAGESRSPRVNLEARKDRRGHDGDGRGRQAKARARVRSRKPRRSASRVSDSTKR